MDDNSEIIIRGGAILMYMTINQVFYGYFYF